MSPPAEPAPEQHPAPAATLPAGERVALVHHWLVDRRGGERCLEALAGLFPGARLFTLVHDPQRCPAPAGVSGVTTSRAQQLPLLGRRFRWLLPVMDRFFAGLDLSGHDLVLSSDASLAKAVRAPAGVPHVCYCYSPVRYAWDLREDYLASLPAPARPPARRLLDRVAAIDRRAAEGVDHFLAISRTVARRIARCYGRSARVVHPPVDTTFFRPGPDDGLDPDRRPYLLLGRSVPYKRFADGVAACARLDRPLVVAGGGPGFGDLRRLAGPRTRFVDEPDDATVRDLLRGCRALLFPGEEDFGLVPVEAMACGRPVVALGAGGATETVVDGVTGVFSEARGVEPFAEALRTFEGCEERLTREACVARAGRFDSRVFVRTMSAALGDLLAGRHPGRPGGPPGDDTNAAAHAPA